jgi:flagellar motor protein MotB
VTKKELEELKKRVLVKPDEKVVILKAGDAMNLVHLGSDELIVKKEVWEQMSEVAQDEVVVTKADWDRRREIGPDEMVVAKADQLRPDKPVIFSLEDTKGFSFESGHADLPKPFADRLENEILKQIEDTVNKNSVDVMEVIGHTDGTPKSGASNMDNALIAFTLNAAAISKVGALKAGSNADLGLARALSVVAFLQSRFAASKNPKLQAMLCRAYSGGQLISPTDNTIDAAINADVPARRRIELRFTQKPKPEKP